MENYRDRKTIERTELVVGRRVRLKGQREFFSGNGTMLYLDCGGDYRNLYIGLNCIELCKTYENW